ncbi:UDP-2,4-diacetamido-2,4,6-trideoxy-beta-L-altropyranose hydrolase [Hymenobacter sp. RP-2-7]|uniref:UDP-2,4-diacetamido-2,4, 6-trideoxy-beta-L-altropyranose hydrolase n=1 Tax=Hymenobacter polaris TaxID=2682546 RepID=A0A7Y0ACP6_9BACT|nr:UDP-2,4-diacetamido-2,4,6-trideoxy-beta-L-altropyranose hydrolase [Hymenobacter polaris]NML64899.1 UDP-2,4-diacetamido-2,4,6-trideoxy-beta-L-altropyranose hydrolase [Hymenobacter polaris]
MATAPRLVLRADGNGRLGLGHLMRLLALAELLRPDFTEVLFLTQTPDEAVRELVRRAGLSLGELPGQPLGPEATATLPPLLRPTDVLVLDGYSFDYAYQLAVRPLVARLVCLDDIHAFPFAADLVLNPAGGVGPAAYDLRTPGARLLSGPAYAPLREEFLTPASPTDPAPSPHQVLLCLGGADPRQLTRATAAALLALPGVAHVHAVAGAAYAGWDELRTWAAPHAERLTLHRALGGAELAALMRQCGAAVLSPSTISYEYCAAGGGLLLLLPTADNQHDLDRFLRAAGLGLPYTTAPNVLTAAEAPRLTQQLRQAQHRCFDGQQGRRLRQEFTALQVPAAPLRLRPVQPADSAQLLAWTNDPATRQQSFDPAPVPLAQHETWLAGQLAQPARYLLLLAEETATGEPAGLIRFALSDNNEQITAILSYSLGPTYRGRGWAAPLLLAGTRAALAHWPQLAQVRGEVKVDNLASVRAFGRAGYQQVASSGPAGSRTFAWVA